MKATEISVRPMHPSEEGYRMGFRHALEVLGADGQVLHHWGWERFDKACLEARSAASTYGVPAYAYLRPQRTLLTTPEQAIEDWIAGRLR